MFCVPEAHILQMAEDELVLCCGLQALALSVFVRKGHMFLTYNTSTVTPLRNNEVVWCNVDRFNPLYTSQYVPPSFYPTDSTRLVIQRAASIIILLYQ